MSLAFYSKSYSENLAIIKSNRLYEHEIQHSEVCTYQHGHLVTFHMGLVWLPMTWVQYEIHASAGYYVHQTLVGEEA